MNKLLLMKTPQISDVHAQTMYLFAIAKIESMKIIKRNCKKLDNSAKTSLASTTRGPTKFSQSNLTKANLSFINLMNKPKMFQKATICF